MRTLSTAVLALGFFASPVSAQWSPVPWGGDYGVNFEYQTTATFSCIHQHYAKQPCTSDGKSVVQWNGNAFAEVSFSGATGSAFASNRATGPIYFGSLNVRYGGVGAFSWPGMVGSLIGAFAMSLEIQTINAPFNSMGAMRFQFLEVPPSLVIGGTQSDYIFVGIPYLQPAHLNYGGMVFERFTLPTIDKLVDADYEIYAAGLSVVPEPSTYALLGLGLVAIGVAARRRKNR